MGIFPQSVSIFNLIAPLVDICCTIYRLYYFDCFPWVVMPSKTYIRFTEINHSLVSKSEFNFLFNLLLNLNNNLEIKENLRNIHVVPQLN